jgi:hypothetical protein
VTPRCGPGSARFGGLPAALAPGLGLAVLACGAGEEALYRRLGPRYEARAWLAATRNPHPFASNRFESPTAAAAFVDSLYRLGADTVYVLNVQQDSAWLAREGGPYADALLIRLPAARQARRGLFDTGARESRREGFDPEPDQGQKYLYLWWD